MGRVVDSDQGEWEPLVFSKGRTCLIEKVWDAFSTSFITISLAGAADMCIEVCHGVDVES